MTRRDCLTIGAAMLSAACTPIKRTGYQGFALIATSGENALAVVDLTNFRLFKTIPLNGRPDSRDSGNSVELYFDAVYG
jgi:hypothetical protein